MRFIAKRCMEALEETRLQQGSGVLLDKGSHTGVKDKDAHALEVLLRGSLQLLILLGLAGQIEMIDNIVPGSEAVIQNAVPELGPELLEAGEILETQSARRIEILH